MVVIFDIQLLSKIRFFLHWALLTGALTACSAYPDKNIDPVKNNKVTFERDAIECAQAYPEAGSGAHVRQRIHCMKLKGWR
jgi:hypothetical protein